MLSCLIAACSGVESLLITERNTVAAQGSGIHAKNRQLGRSINFGNALEAPREGAWGLTLEEAYFARAKEGGFDSIRLPISWTHHTAKTAPYKVDEKFFERVDWAVNQATQRGLNIIVNVHHYDELNADPVAEEARYLAIWRQIAERYQNQDDRVYFELLNEPHGVFNEQPELWNELLARALSVVRESNPTRPVIVGPVGYNSTDQLPELRLPDDPNLIATVHLYDPFNFTHQGADWVEPRLPTGVTWEPERRTLAWNNWSWDTDVAWQDGRVLRVTYQRGWAGLQLHSGAPTEAYTKLSFRAKGAVKLLIGCQNSEVRQKLTTGSRWETYEVDISACGTTDRVVIQNGSPDAQAGLLLAGLRLSDAEGKSTSLFVSERALIRRKLVQARQWARANKRPMFVGEFGAYSEADMTSRVLWTSAVRTEIERRGFSWAYWEFGAGFGVYDPATSAWRERLLSALIP